MEPEPDLSTKGVLEVFSQVYAQAPDRFRIEHPRRTWLAIGNQWWEWGGGIPALSGEGDVVGHLELDRLAWLLDPDHQSTGWGSPSDGIAEISEFLAATYDQPLEAGLFVPPDLEFVVRDKVVPINLLSAVDAAARLPFDLFVPTQPGLEANLAEVLINLLEPMAMVSLGSPPTLILYESPAKGSIKPTFEKRISRHGVAWFDVQMSKSGTAIRLTSAHDREATKSIVDSLGLVQRASPRTDPP